MITPGCVFENLQNSHLHFGLKMIGQKFYQPSQVSYATRLP